MTERDRIRPKLEEQRPGTPQAAPEPPVYDPALLDSIDLERAEDDPEPEPIALPDERSYKEKLYDKIPLNVRQMDIIIGVLVGLLAAALVIGIVIGNR